MLQAVTLHGKASRQGVTKERNHYTPSCGNCTNFFIKNDQYVCLKGFDINSDNSKCAFEAWFDIIGPKPGEV